MKTTAFTDTHIALGAKMQEFAGFNMPIEYSGILSEHINVCKHVGVFDVSHMGEFIVQGEQSLTFLQQICSNDISAMQDGQAQYNCFPNDRGGIVDDLLVYKISDDNYFLVVNASNIEKDWSWCLSHKISGITLHNISDETAQLAVQGPQARDTLQKLTDVNLKEIPYYRFVYGKFAGIPGVMISNTGYTGAGGFELYFPKEKGLIIWNSIFAAGSEFNILPVGLGARDTLRLEMGYCLYGNDIDDTTSPLEAGLGWITVFKEKKKFPSYDFLWKQKTEGVDRKLVAIKMTERGIPRHGYKLMDKEGKIIGKVTSGNISPVLKVGIALGYVVSAYAFMGSTVYVEIRNHRLEAEVVKRPFRK